MTEQTAWYLAQVKPQSYRIAERNLHRQKFETFLPKQKTTSRKNGRFLTSEAPLFPGYLFVAFDLASGAQRKINSTLGISRVVNVAGRPAEVPQSLVDAIRERCTPDLVLEDTLGVSVGDEVTLTTGPFVNFVATIERIDPQRRVWALIDLLGRQTRVQLDRSDWRAA